jgi:hypothetical protein
MEQLTADGSSLPDSLPDNPAMKPTATAIASMELDRVLAHAIRQLIAGQSALIGSPGDRDSQPVV